MFPLAHVHALQWTLGRKHGDVRPELGSDSSFDHRKRCLCQTWCAVEERGRTGIGERTVSNIVPAQKYKTDFIDVVA